MLRLELIIIVKAISQLESATRLIDRPPNVDRADKLLAITVLGSILIAIDFLSVLLFNTGNVEKVGMQEYVEAIFRLDRIYPQYNFVVAIICFKSLIEVTIGL